MKQIFIFLFAFVPALAFSQADTGKIVTHYKGGEINEEYSRNKDGNKDGAYVRYTRFGKKYIVGQYANGTPVGNWEFYSSDASGVLVQKLDFTSHKETIVDSLRIPTMICGPRYFGGNMLKQEFLQLHIKTDFTEAEREQYQGQAFTVFFTIDEKTLKPIGISCTDPGLTDAARKKLIQIVSEMPAWLPPVCGKGADPVWRYSAVFVF